MLPRRKKIKEKDRGLMQMFSLWSTGGTHTTVHRPDCIVLGMRMGGLQGVHLWSSSIHPTRKCLS